MNVTVLIDAIVRQTTVLVAELATAAGSRAPLAHLANQVFLDLVRELKEQGVGNKVIADMFGMALRTYHDKVQRLSESSTFRGKSLWGAVLEFVQDRGPVARAEVLGRFAKDDGATLRGVLADLVDQGLVYRSGRGDATIYRGRGPDDVAGPDDSLERLMNLVWVGVYRYGPIAANELLDVIPADRSLLEEALSKLVLEGRVTRHGAEEPARYGCESCVVGMDEPLGWEAAVFDHYQALVTALTTKLKSGRTRAAPDDRIGGATYSFDVWPEHPHYQEVAGFLAETRRRAVALRGKVDAFNESHTGQDNARHKFIAYVGQTFIESESGGSR